jgi:hypothetical protein
MLKINYFLLLTTKKSTSVLPKKLFSFSSLRLWRIEEDDEGNQPGVAGLKSDQLFQQKVNES